MPRRQDLNSPVRPGGLSLASQGQALKWTFMLRVNDLPECGKGNQAPSFLAEEEMKCGLVKACQGTFAKESGRRVLKAFKLPDMEALGRKSPLGDLP